MRVYSSSVFNYVFMAFRHVFFLDFFLETDNGKNCPLRFMTLQSFYMSNTYSDVTENVGFHSVSSRRINIAFIQTFFHSILKLHYSILFLGRYHANLPTLPILFPFRFM